MDYVDYQDRFPVEFTAYDALHPTWHGARLHALDTVLRLHRQGIVDDARTPAEIAQVFSAMDTAVSDDYRESLDDNYEALRSPGFKRYDIFEPDNAHKLMCYLASMPVGSTLEADHLYRLSLRLRYWQESDFTVPAVDPDAAYTAAFDGATRKEIERARQRASYFQQQLVKFQSSRLNLAPLPGFDPARRVSVSEVTTQLGMLLHLTRYRLEEGREGVAFELADGRAIARGILNKEPDPSYLRVDILGDHSFLLVQPITDTLTFTFPSWARHNKPFVKFGI
jgi:hypothetical protein